KLSDQKEQSVDLLIEGGVVITVDKDRHVYSPGYVAIRDGKIVGVGDASAHPYKADTVIDASGKTVLPGLVNAHNHLDQSLYRGCFDGRRDSRAYMLAMSMQLTEAHAKQAASLSLLEQLHQGITTTQENHWTHYHIRSTDGICDAIDESGMRSFVSRGMNDVEKYTMPELRESVTDVLEDLDRLEEEHDSERIQITSEPCTILRCKPVTILALREWALKREKKWCIHLSQTRERELALETVGMGSVEYAEHLGVLDQSMLAIHCSGISDNEVELLGEHEVSVSHCPVPIMRGGGRVPPIWRLEELGATVAIGTDGSATNNGQNIWEAMKMAVYMQRVRFQEKFLGTAEQALEMTTIKAAEALGMADRTGSIEVGKEADIAILEADQLHLEPNAMLVNNLVLSSCTTRADTVLVGGEVILRNGRSTVLDEDRVISQAREAHVRMVKDAGLEGEISLVPQWPTAIESG
ncbi:amidohydrolase family protein, partial [Candidatus Bipolaricaulota bacterium]